MRKYDDQRRILQYRMGNQIITIEVDGNVLLIGLTHTIQLIRGVDIP